MFVVSFYSYKGGVGRTVALLNSAWHLAKQGARVALLDLDLEAPGLQDAPLAPFGNGWAAPRPSLGFCDLVQDFRNGKLGTWGETRTKIAHYLTVGLGPEHRISLLPAKGADNKAYADFLHEFSWSEFYGDEASPGKVITASIVAALADDGWDYLFVDARTGLTDVRGAALVDMPDLVVFVTNLSQQSVDGIRDQMAVIDEVNEEIETKGSSDSRRPGRLESKIRSLLVCSPLPVGELTQRRSRIADIKKRLGRSVDIQVDYIPFLALDEHHQLAAQTEEHNDSVMQEVMRPYVGLACAIVAANPRAAENVLAQGDKLLEAGRWREALAHYDDVADRATGTRLELRALAGKTRAQLRATPQISKAQVGAKKLMGKASGEEECVRAIDLQLALAWALAVAEKFDDAGEAAEAAWLKARGLSPEVRITCAFAAGQAWNWAGKWKKAGERLQQADRLCREYGTRPLLHALVLAESARVSAVAGPISHGEDAVNRAQDLVTQGLVTSNYVRARVLLGKAELQAEAGNGVGALKSFEGARQAFEKEVELPGALEAIAAIAELSLEAKLDIDKKIVLARELSMNNLAQRLQLAELNRLLASGKKKGWPNISLENDQANHSLLVFKCRLHLAMGEAGEATQALQAAKKTHAPFKHELYLLAPLVDLALQTTHEGLDDLERYAKGLQLKGLNTRLLQVRFVQALFPESRANALSELTDLIISLDGLDHWLWNQPIAFVEYVDALREHFEAVMNAIPKDCPWPRPVVTE